MKRCLAWTVLWAVAWAGASGAHEEVEESVEEQAAALVEVIPLSEIPSRVEASERVLRHFSGVIEPEPSTREIEGALPDVRSELAEQSEVLEALLEGTPSRQRLYDSASDWRYRAAALDRWRRELGERSEELEASVQALEGESGTWEATLEEARAAGAPAAIIGRLEALLARAREVEQQARARRAAVLTLRDRVGRQGLLVDDSLERIETARAEFRAQLLVAEAEPLWQDLRGHALSAYRGRVAESMRKELAQLRAFARSNGAQLLLDMLLFIFLLNVAVAVRRRVGQWTEDDPELGSAAAILQRPVSLALLVSLLVFPTIHPFAPSVVGDVVSVALLVPLLRILPPLFDPGFRRLLYALGLLFLISRSRDLIDSAPSVEQLLFTVQLVASISVLVWRMLPRQVRTLPPGMRFPALLRAGLRVALLLLVAALIADLLGNRSLSKVLGDGVLTAILASLLAYALVRSGDVFLRVILHSERARRLGVVRRRGPTLRLWTSRLLATLVAVGWFVVTLDAFAVREPMRDLGLAVLNASLAVGELNLSLSDVLAFAVTLAAAYALANVLRFFLDEDVLPRMRLRRGVPNAISTLLRYSILIVGFAFALSAAGMDFSRVSLLAGAFGVGIGFGLQNVVNNFVSGLILLFERPIQTGDMLEVGGLLGEVRRIGARSSTIRTVDGAEVIVPNGNLISDQVINWTLSDRRRRIEVAVGVSYGTDPKRVQEILLGLARANETVLGDPEPQALFVGFGDSSLDFLLRCWVPRFEEGYTLRSDLSVAIYAALDEAGIQIPFPQRDLHLRSVDPAAGRSLGGSSGDGSD